ncbi:MAG: hypothetical protein AB1Z23_07030 [Eubacteriales bacterium]
MLFIKITMEVMHYNADATDYSTCLQYLRARYYSTDSQRFIQEDDYKGRFTRPASIADFHILILNIKNSAIILR